MQIVRVFVSQGTQCHFVWKQIVWSHCGAHTCLSTYCTAEGMEMGSPDSIADYKLYHFSQIHAHMRQYRELNVVWNFRMTPMVALLLSSPDSHRSPLTAWPAWLGSTLLVQLELAGASLSTTCPLRRTRVSCGSSLGLSAPSPMSKSSVTSPPTNVRALALSPWPTTMKPPWLSLASMATA